MYVGGIVVLIIFSIFLTQQSGEKLLAAGLGRTVLSGIAAVLGFSLVALQLLNHEFVKSIEKPVEPNVATIGQQMLGVKEHGYALPFEVVSMLLLAAMVACIVIAMRTPKQTEEQMI